MLNELSLPNPEEELPEVDLLQDFEEFVAMLREAYRVRSDLALASAFPLAATAVSRVHTFGSLFGMAGGRVRDQWRFLRGRQNIAPFSAAPSVRLTEQSEEYRYHGKVATGLGLATANHQLAVSFQSRIWNVTHVLLDHLWLETSDDGHDVVEQEGRETVHHAASREHVAAHREFLIDLALPEHFTGADLWADRQQLYPHLDFLGSVEGQLATLTLGGTALSQVKVRLGELEDAVAEWCDADLTAPRWRSLVTSEHEQRKAFCNFVDVDGVTRRFDLHARYTPGAGRIHFRLRSRDQAPQLIVAYIGRKLGI